MLHNARNEYRPDVTTHYEMNMMTSGCEFEVEMMILCKFTDDMYSWWICDMTFDCRA